MRAVCGIGASEVTGRPALLKAAASSKHSATGLTPAARCYAFVTALRAAATRFERCAARKPQRLGQYGCAIPSRDPHKNRGPRIPLLLQTARLSVPVFWKRH